MQQQHGETEQRKPHAIGFGLGASNDDDFIMLTEQQVISAAAEAAHQMQARQQQQLKQVAQSQSEVKPTSECVADCVASNATDSLSSPSQFEASSTPALDGEAISLASGDAHANNASSLLSNLTSAANLTTMSDMSELPAPTTIEPAEANKQAVVSNAPSTQSTGTIANDNGNDNNEDSFAEAVTSSSSAPTTIKLSSSANASLADTTFAPPSMSTTTTTTLQAATENEQVGGEELQASSSSSSPSLRNNGQLDSSASSPPMVLTADAMSESQAQLQSAAESSETYIASAAAAAADDDEQGSNGNNNNQAAAEHFESFIIGPYRNNNNGLGAAIDNSFLEHSIENAQPDNNAILEHFHGANNHNQRAPSNTRQAFRFPAHPTNQMRQQRLLGSVPMTAMASSFIEQARNLIQLPFAAQQLFYAAAPPTSQQHNNGQQQSTSHRFRGRAPPQPMASHSSFESSGPMSWPATTHTADSNYRPPTNYQPFGKQRPPMMQRQRNEPIHFGQLPAAQSPPPPPPSNSLWTYDQQRPQPQYRLVGAGATGRAVATLPARPSNVVAYEPLAGSYALDATRALSSYAAPQVSTAGELNQQSRPQQQRRFKSGLYQIEPPKLSSSEKVQQQQQNDWQFEQQQQTKTDESDANESAADDNSYDTSNDINEQQQAPVDAPTKAAKGRAAAGESGARQVAASIGFDRAASTAAPSSGNAETNLRKGQVFNEPVGSSQLQSNGDGGRVESAQKSLRVAQDVSLYEIEVPAEEPAQQSQVNEQRQQQRQPNYLDTQVYTVPYTITMQPNGNAHFAPALSAAAVASGEHYARPMNQQVPQYPYRVGASEQISRPFGVPYMEPPTRAMVPLSAGHATSGFSKGSPGQFIAGQAQPFAVEQWQGSAAHVTAPTTAAPQHNWYTLAVQHSPSASGLQSQYMNSNNNNGNNNALGEPSTSGPSASTIAAAANYSAQPEVVVVDQDATEASDVPTSSDTPPLARAATATAATRTTTSTTMATPQDASGRPDDSSQALAFAATMKSPSAFCADRAPGLYADIGQRCRVSVDKFNLISES